MSSSRREFIDIVKANFAKFKKANLKVFGITKSKTLVDFVTSEKDVQKGNTRMPLELSRVFEEDMLAESKVVGKMKAMKIDDDDLMANIENRQNIIRKTMSKA